MYVFSDGAARGNPGPAGAGAVIKDASGKVLQRLKKALGKTTNNVAEYKGLILGLRKAQELGAREVEVRADSELMIKQLNGKYAVRNEGLKPLYNEAKALLETFKWNAEHIPREENAEADEMSNRAIDEDHR
ncbi:MAG: ribonuclease HI family protein [Deltaproteobacteria bacterium]|nr:MAG: ribonuclease HI family protein [Deltaproteobacteria bacterium]